MLQGYLSELFLIHISEALVLSFVIALFLRVKLEYIKIIMIAIIVGLSVFMLRSISIITFGYHSIIAILLYVILFTNIFNENSIESFLAVLKTFVILAIYEVISISLMTYYLNISIETFLDDFILKTVTVWINIIFIFLTGYIFFRFINKKKIRKS